MLIKQLQEQHYYQYMHQLYQQQQCSDSSSIEMMSGDSASLTNSSDTVPEDQEHETSLTETKESEVTIEASLAKLDLGEEGVEPEEAQMWTRKDINEFKDTIRKEESEAIIKVKHFSKKSSKLRFCSSDWSRRNSDSSCSNSCGWEESVLGVCYRQL